MDVVVVISGLASFGLVGCVCDTRWAGDGVVDDACMYVCM